MDIFTVAAKIKLDSSEFTDGLKKAGAKIGTFASKIGGVAKTAAKVSGAALAAGATAIGAVVKQSVDAYGQYEQLVGGMETLFKDSADEIIGYASEAYKTAGMSANEYMETATQFSASLLKSLDGDTAKAAKYADKAIRQMSDNVNKMGTSVEMVQNAYRGFARGNFTMLDNLSLGYAGTKAGMEELLATAQELSAQQGEYREFSIESYADIVDAIGLVQDKMGITGTTAKEAAGTVTGSLASVKASWQNLLTGFGDSNADVSELMGEFVESVTGAASNIAPVVGQALKGITTVIEQEAPELIGKLPGVIKSAIPEVTNTAKNLIKAFTDELPGIVSAIGEIAPDVLGAVGEVFGGIIEAIPGSIDSITKLLTDDNGKLVEMVDEAGDFLVEQVPKIVDAGLNLFSALLDKAPDIIINIGEKIPDLIKGIVGNSEEGTGLLGHLDEIAAGGVKLMGALFRDGPKIMQEVAGGLADLIDGILKWIGDEENLKKMWNWGLDFARNFLGGMLYAIENPIKYVANKAGEILYGSYGPEANPILEEDLQRLREKAGRGATEEEEEEKIVSDYTSTNGSEHSFSGRSFGSPNVTVVANGVSPEEITNEVTRALTGQGVYAQ